MAVYLVTGGCGFIGSHLCEALLAQGHAVRVLDDLSTGSLANLPSSAGFIRGSVTDRVALAQAMEGVDGCFHLAAIASVERCRVDWLDTHHVNLGGTIGVFETVARQERPIPVVYASSAAVYGDTTSLPIFEDAAKQPSSAYGADKLGCELHARVAAKTHGIPNVGLRFFNVYGPRQDPRSPYSGVISIFGNRIARGDRIEVYGDGNQTRDFVAVNDVADALIASMMRPSLNGAVYNVCTGYATSILQLANTIGSACGKAPDLFFAPPRGGEIKHSVGSRQAGVAALGLPPATTLQTGLQRTMEWLRS